MKDLDLSVKNLFQELLESSWLRLRLEKEIRQEPTYVKKIIKGQDYWYSQVYQKGTYQQKYLGKASKELLDKVKKARELLKNRRSQVRQAIKREEVLVGMLLSAGLPFVPNPADRLLKQLSKIGLLSHQAVLVGTYAFMSYSGLLGVKLNQTSLRTLDIDMAQDVEKLGPSFRAWDLEEVLGNFKEKFHAVPGLDPSVPPVTLVGPGQLRLDFLVPLKGRAKKFYYFPSVRQMGAQALRLLDFLIEQPVQSLLLTRRSAIPIQVPHPARFAIHKLLLSTRRGVHELAKKQKDLIQAEQMIEVLLREDPLSLKKFYKVACKSGKKWEKLLNKAQEGLPEHLRLSS